MNHCGHKQVLHTQMPTGQHFSPLPQHCVPQVVAHWQVPPEQTCGQGELQLPQCCELVARFASHPFDA